MNSLPLSESRPWMGNGKPAIACWSAANTHFCALLGTATVSVQPVAPSTQSRV